MERRVYDSDSYVMGRICDINLLLSEPLIEISKKSLESELSELLSIYKEIKNRK